MLEHLNEMKWDSLEKVFREVTGNAFNTLSTKTLATHFINDRHCTVMHSFRDVDTGDQSFDIRMVINGSPVTMSLILRQEEDPFTLDLRLGLSWYYPHGWIDMPDES